MQIRNTADFSCAEVLEGLSKVEPVSTDTSRRLAILPAIGVIGEYGDLLVANVEEANFDNSERHVLVRYVFSSTQCSHEFVKASWGLLMDFLRKLDSDICTVEGYVNQWETTALSALVDLGFKLAGKTIFTTSEGTLPCSPVQTIPFQETDLDRYFQIDQEASTHLVCRSPSWQLKNMGKRGLENVVSERDEEEYTSFGNAVRRFVSRNDFFGFEIEGKPVGYLLLNNDSIDSIALAKGVQGKGHGSALFRHGCQILRSRGIDRMRGLTSANNIESVRFMGKNGFLVSHVSQWFCSEKSDLLKNSSKSDL